MAAIHNQAGTDFLEVNPDGSININLAVSSSNPLPVLTKSDTVLTNTGTIGALNANIVLAVTNGYKTASAIFTDGNISGSFEIQASFDNGTTYRSLTGKRVDSPVDAASGWSFTGSNLTGKAYQCSIPAGVTHVQMICTAYTSGTSTGKLIVSSDSTSTVTPVIMQSGVARFGFIAKAGIWYDDTSAALAGSASFTSTTRDVTGTSGSSAINSANSYANEYRVLATQDVAFTLYLEVSRDNSTFRRIKQVIAAQNVTSGLYIAELRETPAWRYYRYVIVNGAGAAAHTTGGSILLAG